MGKSYTYHVIGCAPLSKDQERCYPAMNRLEMAQQREKAKRQGAAITYWYAQTGTGRRILKGEWQIKDSEIDIKGIIKCDVCGGIGHVDPKGGIINLWCVVCDGSGVTRKGESSRWMPWQIKEMTAKWRTK